MAVLAFAAGHDRRRRSNDGRHATLLGCPSVLAIGAIGSTSMTRKATPGGAPTTAATAAATSDGAMKCACRCSPHRSQVA